jgi:hypothetical protein
LNDIIGLYKSIGNTLKQEFAGYQAWVISSDQKALGFIGLRPSAKLPVFNGQLECRFEHFDLYKGSKRGRYMDGENQEDAGNKYADRHFNRDDKPNWRSKEAPEGEFDSLDPKPREFKPRSERTEREPVRRERPGKGNFENRPPRRDDDTQKSEYKSREFKPREYKPRDASGDNGFIPREKKEFIKEDLKSDKPVRGDRFGKDDRTERRKVEKVKLKPATRIEERDEYLHPKKIFSETSAENQEIENPVVLPEPTPETFEQKVPSKGNKFTEQRDYKILRTRELRPRKPKPAEDVPEQPKVKPLPKVAKPEPKNLKPPINYDDLED